MKYLQQISIILTTLFHVSCNQLETKKRSVIVDKTQNSHIEVDKTLENVFDFSEDTIFACKYRSGLIYSTNKGKNWTQIADSILFDEITITNNGYLVGLDSWKGIHEADYSRLFISKDFGKTWQTVTLNTEKFFPISIVSLPNHKLQLQTVENKIFELTGKDYLKDWKFVKSIKEHESIYGIIENPIKVDDYDDHNIKLYKKNGNVSDTLIKLNLCREVNNVLNSEGIIYVSGSGYNTLSDEKGYAYFATLNRKRNLIEYKLPGSYAYLKRTQLNNIYVFNDAGLFIIEKDSLKKIY